MAKVKGPLMSMDASGTVANTVVFSSWKGVKYVRRHAVPSNPKTGNQVGVRAHFAGIVLLYKALTAGNKALWTTLGAVASITGLNQMVYTGQRNFQALQGVQKLPTRVDDTPPAAPSALSTAVSGNRVTLSWTASVTADAYATFIYRGIVTGFTPGPDNLVGVVANSTIKWSEVLSAGDYWYKLKCDDNDGNLSSATASSEAVVS